VLAITQGLGIAYVVSRTLSGGRCEGLASCIGTRIGGLVHVITSALGVSLPDLYRLFNPTAIVSAQPTTDQPSRRRTLIKCPLKGQLETC